MNRCLVTVTAALCAVSLLVVCVPVSSADFVQGENMTVKTKDTPRLRLEQTAEEFPARSWDLAGNQTNFFVRDATGDTVPFRVGRAPNNSFTVAEDGRIGIGVANPQATVGALQIEAWGEARTVYTDPAPADPNPSWSAGIPAFQDAFGIGPYNHAPVLLLTPDGEAEVSGSLSENANTGSVAEVKNVNSAELLAKVASLPIKSWRFADSPSSVRHLGPLADYFGPAFGVGRDVRHLAPADVAGVSLAAVQGLIARNTSLEARVQSAEARIQGVTNANDALTERVGNLAKQLKSLRRAVHRLK
jgi:hypothetical protein